MSWVFPMLSISENQKFKENLHNTHKHICKNCNLFVVSWHEILSFSLNFVSSTYATIDTEYGIESK